jgi:predicted O-methyltransferase YrrM
LKKELRGNCMGKPELFGAEYFREFTPHENGVLVALEKEALEKDIPIVGPFVGKMLWLFVKLIDAKRVLELGTATGYSAIWMASALRETGGELTTIEWEDDTAKKAQVNIEDAGYTKEVTVLTGDAKDLLPTFEADYFDLIFQDVEKEMYLDLLNPCARILRPSGLILFDNTAFMSAGDFLSKSLEHPHLDGFHLHAFLPEHDPEYDVLTFLIKK